MYPTEELASRDSRWYDMSTDTERNWANEQADFAFAERMEHEMYQADNTDVPDDVKAEFDEFDEFDEPDNGAYLCANEE